MMVCHFYVPRFNREIEPPFLQFDWKLQGRNKQVPLSLFETSTKNISYPKRTL